MPPRTFSQFIANRQQVALPVTPQQAQMNMLIASQIAQSIAANRAQQVPPVSPPGIDYGGGGSGVTANDIAGQYGAVKLPWQYGIDPQVQANVAAGRPVQAVPPPPMGMPPNASRGGQAIPGEGGWYGAFPGLTSGDPTRPVPGSYTQAPDAIGYGSPMAAMIAGGWTPPPQAPQETDYTSPIAAMRAQPLGTAGAMASSANGQQIGQPAHMPRKPDLGSQTTPLTGLDAMKALIFGIPHYGYLDGPWDPAMIDEDRVSHQQAANMLWWLQHKDELNPKNHTGVKASDRNPPIGAGARASQANTQTKQPNAKSKLGKQD